MERPLFGYEGYAQAPPPPEGFWRVSAWHEPFDPPPPAPALGADPRDDDGHRFDDPRGVHRTLYGATHAEGALGECLGEFAYNASAAVRIEAFLDGEPDGGHDESPIRPLDEADILAFEWRLAHAAADPQARCFDVESWRTLLASSPRLVPALARFGVRVDRHVLVDPRRHVTRVAAGVWRHDAVDPITGELRVSGLRFLSRLATRWECWALWEPLPLDTKNVEIEEVTIDTPALRSAAAMLGVALELGR